jgi:hypothetical protein
MCVCMCVCVCVCVWLCVCIHAGLLGTYLAHVHLLPVPIPRRCRTAQSAECTRPEMPPAAPPHRTRDNARAIVAQPRRRTCAVPFARADVYTRARIGRGGGAPVVGAAHSSCTPELPAPTAWGLKYAVLRKKEQPRGEEGSISTKYEGTVLPMAVAAVRHATSVSIRTEPAGHSLLPSAPDTYAPVHDPGQCRSGRALAALRCEQYCGGTREYPASTPPRPTACQSRGLPASTTVQARPESAQPTHGAAPRGASHSGQFSTPTR